MNIFMYKVQKYEDLFMVFIRLWPIYDCIFFTLKICLQQRISRIFSSRKHQVIHISILVLFALPLPAYFRINLRNRTLKIIFLKLQNWSFSIILNKFNLFLIERKLEIGFKGHCTRLKSKSCVSEISLAEIQLKVQKTSLNNLVQICFTQM